MGTLFETGIRPAVDAWLLAKSKEVRSYGDYWSASSAGYCQRKVIFERIGIPHVEKEDDARKQRVFTAGHLFHDWLQGITKAAGISIAQEVELQDEDLMIRGHFDDLVLVGGECDFCGGSGQVESGGMAMEDDLYEVAPCPDCDGTGKADPNHLILYDYKTRNSKNFNYAKRPSYFHRLQLGTYMYMLRKLMVDLESLKDTKLFTLGDQLKDLTEARILSIEKDTLRMAEVQYMWDDKLEKDVLAYWNSLNEHWKKKTLPKCTCTDHEGGFMALEKWNPYFKDGEPCSIKVYQEWKAKAKEKEEEKA